MLIGSTLAVFLIPTVGAVPTTKVLKRIRGSHGGSTSNAFTVHLPGLNQS